MVRSSYITEVCCAIAVNYFHFYVWGGVDESILWLSKLSKTTLLEQCQCGGLMVRGLS
jgi:hypothetical protein